LKSHGKSHRQSHKHSHRALFRAQCALKTKQRRLRSGSSLLHSARGESSAPCRLTTQEKEQKGDKKGSQTIDIDDLSLCSPAQARVGEMLVAGLRAGQPTADPNPYVVWFDWPMLCFSESNRLLGIPLPLGRQALLEIKPKDAIFDCDPLASPLVPLSIARCRPSKRMSERAQHSGCRGPTRLANWSAMPPSPGTADKSPSRFPEACRDRTLPDCLVRGCVWNQPGSNGATGCGQRRDVTALRPPQIPVLAK